MHLFRLLVPAIALVAVATGAQASPESDRFTRLLDEAAGATQPAVAMARLLDASSLEAWVPPALAVDAWATTAAAVDNALVRDLARYMALRAAWQGGEAARADEIEAQLDFVTQWRVIGPFANDGMAGLTTAYGPETDGVSVDATYEGKAGTVAWHEVVGDTETGYIELNALFHPSVNAAFYAATEFELARDADVTLSLAIDGAYRIWVDGVAVAEQREHLGGFFVRDEVDVALDRGQHQIVIKLAGIDSLLGMHVRVLDADGDAIAVEARPATAPIALEPSQAWATPRTLASGFSSLLAGTDAAALAAAAAVACTLLPEDPSQPWTPFIDAALRLNPGASDLARMALCFDEHWRRVELLSRAHAAAPDDPFVTLAYIDARRAEMGQDAVDEVSALVADLLALPEPPLTAIVLQADLLNDANLYYSAFDLACGLAERESESSGAAMACERMASTVNRDDITADLALTLARLDSASLGRWERLLDVMRVRGEDSADLVARLVARWPLTPQVFEVAATDARARGELSGAEARLSEGLLLCPTCTDLLDARARLRIELGDREGAAADFAALLAVEPQDAFAREYLTVLAQDEDRFYDPWRVSDEQIAGMRVGDAVGADVPFTWLVDQSMTHVHPNGLATTWIQQAMEAHTRAGADSIRSFGVTFTPDAEQVEVLGARVIRPDGSIRAVYDTAEYGGDSGPAAMYFDVRQRAVYLPNVEPGDIVVIEYTTEDIAYRNIFDDYFGEMWTFQSAEPRVLARYGVRAPLARTLYTGGNDRGLGAWTTTEDDGDAVMVFEARDVPAVRYESSSPGASETLAHLSVSTYGDWNDLADWYWQLVDSQLVLTPEIEATVAEVTAGLTTNREKAAAIHNWVVRNTRYVGLEFGIHGYKPYRTSECFARRFGDCKDTASLMKVMLEAAGIPARLVLVRTRDQGRVDEFPPSLAVFNHVIAYVPELELYLDGTAGFSGSGELPSLDQGASALIVNDGSGGTFHEIPWLSASASVSQVDLELDLSGQTPTARGQLRMTGAFAPSMRREFEAAELRTEHFREFFSGEVAGIEVSEVAFNDLGDIEHPVEIAFSLEGGDWARVQGDQLVLQLFATDSELLEAFAGASTRTMPLSTGYPFVLDENYEIRVAAGLVPVDLPGGISIDSDFGSLHTEVAFADGVLATRFFFTLEATSVEPERYADFREFMGRVDEELSRVIRFAPESP
jgi:transglutaminase-like putative cysteine protease